MDEDLKILLPEDKFLSIGNKKYKIWISAERSLKATIMFNDLIKKCAEENKSISTDLEVYKKYIEISLTLIKQDFVPALKNVGLSTIFSWRSRQRLNTDNILKTMDIKELEMFVNNALEPIIGTKKKEQERQEKAAEAMMILMDTITPEALAELLRSSLQGVDTKKVM